MRWWLGAVLGTWLAVQVAAAVELRLRDGTRVTAEEVRVTGSYVMLVLADGRQLAYDIADVDPASLEAIRSGDADQERPPVSRSGSLGTGRSLNVTETVDRTPTSGLAITDREVRHVRGSGVLGDQELAEAPDESGDGGIPDGYQRGGGVLVNAFQVTPIDDGRWNISGELVNRNSDPVRNVSVQLESPAAPGVEGWRTTVDLVSLLEVNGKVEFSHDVEIELPPGRTEPEVRAYAVWLQHGDRQPTPTRPPMAAPASPSNLGTSVLPTATPIL